MRDAAVQKIASSTDELTYQFKESPYSSHHLVLEQFPVPGNGRTVLDVGCGDGYLGSILAERGYSVTGIERRGGYSQRFPSSVELIEADLEQGLPPIQQQFNYIVCADILEHLRRPEDLLVNLRSLLKPGGTLIASLPNSGNIYFRLNILFGRFPQDDKGLFDRTHVRFYMWQGWKQLFAGAGLRLERIAVTPIPFTVAYPSAGAPVRWAEAAYTGLARLWASLFAYQFVVVAKINT